MVLEALDAASTQGAVSICEVFHEISWTHLCCRLDHTLTLDIFTVFLVEEFQINLVCLFLNDVLSLFKHSHNLLPLLSQVLQPIFQPAHSFLSECFVVFISHLELIPQLKALIRCLERILGRRRRWVRRCSLPRTVCLSLIQRQHRLIGFAHEFIYLTLLLCVIHLTSILFPPLQVIHHYLASPALIRFLSNKGSIRILCILHQVAWVYQIVIVHLNDVLQRPLEFVTFIIFQRQVVQNFYCLLFHFRWVRHHAHYSHEL